MKRTKCLVALLALMLCFTLAFACCENLHIHTFNEQWAHDDTHHWKVCSDCQGIANKAEHDWNGGENVSDFEKLYTCKTCSRTKTEITGTLYSKGLAFEAVENGFAVVGIGSCQDLDVVLPSMHDGLPVVSIGQEAFCESIITSISVPNSVERIEIRAFANCANLSAVSLEEGVKYIGTYAFVNCTSLESIAIPNSVTEASTGVFQDCTNLSNVTIGSGLTTLESWFFFGCTSLVNVTLPSTITVLDRRAFENCSNLESVVLGKDVLGIATFAFLNCEKLASIYYEGTPESWANIDFGSSVFDQNSALTVYYFSDGQPTDTANKYWHYENGEIVVWPL